MVFTIIIALPSKFVLCATMLYASNLLALLSFALLMLVAAVSDAFTYRISNRLNLSLVLLFAFAALWAKMPLAVLFSNVSAGLSLLALGLVLFRLRAFGGGDAKLMAAAALWLGWSALLPFLIWTALAGGLLGLVLLLIRWVRRLRGGPMRRDVPYGIALAAGALLALPESYWWLPV